MAEGQLKKRVFVTPEKPGDVEKTCWDEDEKPRKPKSKAKVKRAQTKSVCPEQA